MWKEMNQQSKKILASACKRPRMIAAPLESRAGESSAQIHNDWRDLRHCWRPSKALSVLGT